MLLGILAIIMFLVITVLVIGWFMSAPAYRGEGSNHFDGKRFINAANVRAKDGWDLIKWMTNRKQGPWQVRMDIPYGPKPAPIVEVVTITYVNHSTFLIQCMDLTILTDPIWSDRTSPVQWAGPKRTRPPGIKFEDLPNIDLVLISHNHYDHLDKATVVRIIKAHNPQFIVPLGVGQFMSDLGAEKVKEVDWWQEVGFNDSAKVKVTALPAQHFSGRGIFDRDRTLWAGYGIDTEQGTIYFAGDTGYGDIFKEIGRRLPNISVALLPIGAYVPGWFMSPIHISPQEAVQVHIDLGADISIGMHQNTFPLADDGMTQPVEDLQKALRAASLTDRDFMILQEGVPFKLLKKED